MDTLPQRTTAHIVGDEAVRLFIEACPPEWIPAPLARDYGLDETRCHKNARLRRRITPS